MSLDRDDFESDESWNNFLISQGRVHEAIIPTRFPINEEELDLVNDHSNFYRDELTTEEADPGESVADYIVRSTGEREPVSHYETPGGIETIDYIKSLGWLEPFSLANALKYISRAGKKEGNSKLGDLKKAQVYLDFVIQELESEDETE